VRDNIGLTDATDFHRN